MLIAKHIFIIKIIQYNNVLISPYITLLDIYCKKIEKYFKYDSIGYIIIFIIMYKSIILAYHLFGSAYLFSKSLEMINMLSLENKKIPNSLIVLNGLVFMGSSYVFFWRVRNIGNI